MVNISGLFCFLAFAKDPIDQYSSDKVSNKINHVQLLWTYNIQSVHNFTQKQQEMTGFLKKNICKLSTSSKRFLICTGCFQSNFIYFFCDMILCFSFTHYFLLNNTLLFSNNTFFTISSLFVQTIATKNSTPFSTRLFCQFGNRIWLST